jgi:hypothetical protein
VLKHAGGRDLLGERDLRDGDSQHDGLHKPGDLASEEEVERHDACYSEE